MLLVNLLGFVLIALIVWWFWLYREATDTTPASTRVITVDNGIYQPARIRIPANQAQTLTFLRKDKSPCAETVVFPKLELSETLTVDQAVQVQLPALKPGVYAFHCQMQMYKGELNVEE